MDLKTDIIGNSTVHEEMKELPNPLTGRNIASIEILFDFFIASSKLHGDALMAFVHILVDVLDSLNASTFAAIAAAKPA
jgi:hypothetical protein